MAHEVFICYASRDKNVAEAICDALESRQIKCWIAPRDVLPGTEWAEIIVDALDESRVLVLVLSSNSNRSPQVIREVGRAAGNGIPIIPLRIDDVTLSKAMDYFVSRHHFLDALTLPLEKHLKRLADTVQQILGRKGAPEGIIEKAEAEAEERVKKEEAARAKREAEEARKAKEAEEKARKEAELAAKEKAKKETEEKAKKEAEEKAKKEAEEAAKAARPVTHCPKCGVELRPNVSFCHKCGTRVSEREKAQEAAARTEKEEEAARAKREGRKAREAEEKARKEAEEKAKKEAEEAAKAARPVTHCPKCGVELRPNVSFCHKCGARVSEREKAQ